MRTGRGAARIHHSFFAARRFSHRYPVRMENAGSEELGPRCERFLYRRSMEKQQSETWHVYITFPGVR